MVVHVGMREVGLRTQCGGGAWGGSVSPRDLTPSWITESRSFPGAAALCRGDHIAPGILHTWTDPASPQTRAVSTHLLAGSCDSDETSSCYASRKPLSSRTEIDPSIILAMLCNAMRDPTMHIYIEPWIQSCKFGQEPVCAGCATYSSIRSISPSTSLLTPPSLS